MIGQNTPDCALGLTTDTLSAWRGGGFRGDEEQRIRQHTATCVACQQRLDGFVTVARALGRQRELEPGDRVWRGVQDRIVTQRHGRSTLPRSSARNWQGVAAVASVILVVGLLAYVFNAVRAQRGGFVVTGTATSATTPTLTSSITTIGPQLVWQPAHYPPGMTSASLALAPRVVAPNDGDVAYLCVAPAQGETNAHIYITHDRGQTWARGGDVPVGAQPPSSGKAFMLECGIVVDATRPDTAVVETEWLQAGASGDNSLISSFASFDYGAHWRKLVYSHIFVIGPKMVSYAGAIFASGAAQIRGGDAGLWVSHDQMKTWQALTMPPGVVVSAFWLNPSTGALLVAANWQESRDSLLLTSADGGGRWTQLPLPSSAQMTWVVQTPQGDRPWRICGAAASLDTSRVNTLTCSSDGGQTWATRPALNVVQNSPKGQLVASGNVFALAGDGAALATVFESSVHLYRLPAGGSVWEDLGPTPTSSSPGPTYFPTPTGGALWLTSSNVFTAVYPPA
jgi:hypothetical protein